MKDLYLSVAVAAVTILSLPTISNAQSAKDVDEVIVRSNPSQKAINEIISVSNIISEDRIQADMARTIGELLGSVPGVHNASHGPAVGRPVIRGQGGYRVGTLENGIAIADVSATGNDHANAFGLFDLERVEVLKGPSALRYGPYGNTGVVNSFNRHLNFDGEAGGQISIGGGNAADERHQALFVQRDFDTLSLSLSAFDAESENSRVPTHSESKYQLASEGESAADVSGDVESTQSESDGISLSTRFQLGQTNIALMATQYDLSYGVPGHAHEEEHEGEEEADGEEEHAEEAAISIGMERETFRSLMTRELDGPFEKFEAHLHIGEFSQTEFEGNMAATTFRHDVEDLKIELFNAPLYGWQGVLGLSMKTSDVTADGEEAYFPSSDEETNSLYIVQSRDMNNWIGEFAVRLDQVDLETTGMSRDFDSFNMSAGAGYKLNNKAMIGGSITASERAPSLIELFADGVHAAAKRYERGNASLDMETSIASEVYYRRSFEAGDAQISFYRNDYDNFIYLADAGLLIEEAPVYDYLTSDAVIEGVEISASTSGRLKAADWTTRIFISELWGELADGSNMRSLPPRKIGLDAEFRSQTVALNLGVIHAFAQKDYPVGQFPSDSFTDINARLTWKPATLTGVRLIAAVDNLLDSEIRHHTSELKDLVPEPGRNVKLTASISF